MENKRIIEAMLFASSRPISLEEFSNAIKISKDEVKKEIKELMKFYKKSAIEISEINGKYAMQLRDEYTEYAKSFSPIEVPKSLLKTLALIAYHQPVKQSELKRMIGSGVYQYVKELKKRGFINTKKEGRTKRIELSNYFYDYFGIDKKNKEIKEMLLKKMKQD
ncbi:MAG: SMC-Scp complex subunit ScpB [Thermoplasmata archaeon]|nr:SMC-Scp complex subunit ScpB [Thermoplasmata archaeon]